MNVLQACKFQNGQGEIASNKFAIHKVNITEVTFLKVALNEHTVTEFIINELLIDVIDLVKGFSVMKFDAHFTFGWNQI